MSISFPYGGTDKYTYNVFAFVEARQERSHDRIFGEWSLHVDQVFHVLGQYFVGAVDGFAGRYDACVWLGTGLRRAAPQCAAIRHDVGCNDMIITYQFTSFARKARYRDGSSQTEKWHISLEEHLNNVDILVVGEKRKSLK